MAPLRQSSAHYERHEYARQTLAHCQNALLSICLNYIRTKPQVQNESSAARGGEYCDACLGATVPACALWTLLSLQSITCGVASTDQGAKRSNSIPQGSQNLTGAFTTPPVRRQV